MMAEAPKSTKPDKSATTAKAKPSDPASKLAKGSKGAIEDAGVIGETPPKDAATKSPDSADQKNPAAAAKTSGTSDTSTQPSEKATSIPKTKSKPVPPPKSTTAPDPAGKEEPKDTAKPAQPERRRGGIGAFLGLLLGGVAAAVIGFVAARTVVPEGWPFPGVPPEEDPLVGAVEAQDAQIAALEERVAALDTSLAAVQSDTSAVDDLRATLTTRLDGLETGANDLVAQLDAMETRLASVEKLAPEGSAAAEAAAAAYARELEALREMFAGELAEIDAAQAEATALEAQLAQSAQAAAGRAALAQVSAALETGEPFEAALSELTDTTGAEVPDVLVAVAADGVSALADLQNAFPAAARSAIDAAIRSGVEDGSVNRMQAFLRTQLGTRSLEPREGDDADAVLSRAEAALKTGDLAATLAEIDALPDAAKPALAEWRALAETRAQALAAGANLAEELNAK